MKYFFNFYILFLTGTHGHVAQVECLIDGCTHTRFADNSRTFQHKLFCKWGISFPTHELQQWNWSLSQLKILAGTETAKVGQ